jgi:hypothetical protein
LPTASPSSRPSTPRKSTTTPPSPWRKPASAWAVDPAWVPGFPTASAPKHRTFPRSAS